MRFSKKYLLAALLLCSATTFAQTPVEFHITHKLNGINNFSYNQSSKNNLGNNFSVTRLEYYISKISITHDGGTVTDIPNHYILVDAAQNTADQLGSYNITNIESISFHIGVDTPANHSDPSARPNGHPLAPKAPSMHWGWTSGYRFVAFEGKSGPNLQQDLQVHSLFNQYYYKQTVSVGGVLKNGKLIIGLYADYAQALRDVNVSSGLFNHGDRNAAQDIRLLENFRDHVFKPGTPVSASNINSKTETIDIYPNPSNGFVNISYSNTNAASISILDLRGKTVASFSKKANKQTVQLKLNNTGLYFVKTVFEDGQSDVQKLIVQ